jgi:hypothetical protein
LRHTQRLIEAIQERPASEVKPSVSSTATSANAEYGVNAKDVEDVLGHLRRRHLQQLPAGARGGRSRRAAARGRSANCDRDLKRSSDAP